MSGGSLGYAYRKVEDIANAIDSRAKTPLQKAFAGHLFDVSGALHDLEWVYSCDYGEGDEVKAIKRVLGNEWAKLTADRICAALEVVKKDASNLIKDIKKEALK